LDLEQLVTRFGLLTRVTETLALRCSSAALLPWAKDSSAEPATQPAGQTNCAAMDLSQKLPTACCNSGHLVATPQRHIDFFRG